MKEMIKTDRVIVVEGKYDAAKLAGITDAAIVMTDGFGIYSDREKQKLLKALAKKSGLVLLLDSDAAGFQIRRFITDLAGDKNVVQAYIPAVAGKEPRKAEPGREGLLGVEGVSDGQLLSTLADALRSDATPANDSDAPEKARAVTYYDLYAWGLSGTADSAARRAVFLKAIGLPPRLSKKALVDILNKLYTYDELFEKKNEVLGE